MQMYNETRRKTSSVRLFLQRKRLMRDGFWEGMYYKKTIQHNRSSRNNILPERSQCQPCQLKMLDTERNAYNGDAQQ